MSARLTFISPTFSCKLQCGQCQQIKPDNSRCKNRVCFGLSRCWIHTKALYGVKVRPSNVHGKGLFATKDFATNDWICPYEGEPITPNCLEERYPGDVTAPYSVESRNGNIVDSACARGVGAMANGLFKQNGYSKARYYHNAVLAERGNDVWLRARKPINVNSEIHCYYGNSYRLEQTHETKRTSRVDTRPC